MLSLRKKYVVKYNIYTSFKEIADVVNDCIVKQVQNKPNSILALGSEKILNKIYDHSNKSLLKKINFSDVIIFGVKDYIDIDTRYLKYSKFNLLNEHFINLTNIKIDNVFWPKPDIGDTYDEKIESLNGIDLLILSVRNDGRIGFNEPGTSIRTRTHNAQLSKNTINNLVDVFDEKINAPTHGITMGLKTILSAKKIILVALGSSNASAVNELMNGRYLHSCPVTSLIYHHDVTVCLDLESASLFDNK